MKTVDMLTYDNVTINSLYEELTSDQKHIGQFISKYKNEIPAILEEIETSFKAAFPFNSVIDKSFSNRVGLIPLLCVKLPCDNSPVTINLYSFPGIIYHRSFSPVTYFSIENAEWPLTTGCTVSLGLPKPLNDVLFYSISRYDKLVGNIKTAIDTNAGITIEAANLKGILSDFNSISLDDLEKCIKELKDLRDALNTEKDTLLTELRQMFPPKQVEVESTSKIDSTKEFVNSFTSTVPEETVTPKKQGKKKPWWMPGA